MSSLTDYWEDRILEDFPSLIGDSTVVDVAEEVYPLIYGYLYLLERVNTLLGYDAVVIDELVIDEAHTMCKIMPLDGDCEIYFDYIKNICQYMSTATSHYYDEKGTQ